MLKLLLLISCVLVAGCSETNDTPLRIGTNLWPGYEPLYLARELGYMDKHQIRLVEYTSTSQVFKAYRSGLLDAAAVTLDEAITMIAQGEDIKIVLVLDVSDGADVLLGQSELKSIGDIQGKRVGVEHSALGAFYMNRILEVSGIDKTSVTIVPNEVQHHERAFQKKEVDAIITFDPVRSRLLAQGANLLFDSSQLPGEIVDVLVVRKAMYNKYSNQINALKDAWYKALHRFKNTPEDFVSILNMRMKLGEENILSAFEDISFPDKLQNQHLLDKNSTSNLRITSKKMADTMLENKLISFPVNTDNLFN